MFRNPTVCFCAALLCLLFLITASCSNRVLPDEHKEIMALQPLQGYSREQTALVCKELEAFFQRKIVVLPGRDIPPDFINMEKGKRYAADKVIKWLADTRPDSVAIVIGLTAEDIYVTKRDEAGNIKKPESTYGVWGVFGLGYRPGRACIVSDKRLKTPDEQRYRHRLRTVVLHEAGHNLDLPHCPSQGCIMSDANERIATVDGSGRDYCAACRKRLHFP